MSVTFVRGAPPYVRHFNLLEDEVILVFDPALERFSKSVGDRFRELDPVVRMADLVIFRGSNPSLIEDLSGDVIIKSLLRDTPVAAIVGAGSSYSMNTLVDYRRVPGFLFPEWVPSPDFIRSLELRTILEQAEAILLPPSDHHFSLPSGVHAEKFIRLGDALLDVVSLARIGDWVAQYLDETTAILGDTRALLPLLLELNNRFNRAFSRNLEFDVLREYPTETFSIVDKVADLSRRVSPRGRLVLLLSVEASGRLSKIFRSLAPEGSLIISVCNTNKNSTADEVLLAMQVERWDVNEKGECEKCSEGNLIGIDPCTFERSLATRWESVLVRYDMAADVKSFWVCADAADAVRLHVNLDQATEGPSTAGEVVYRMARPIHYGVYLDVGKMLDSRDFRGKCISKLLEVPRPDLVLIPSHICAAKIAQLVDEVFNGVPIQYVLPGRIGAHESKAILAASKILIVDDALVSGATLRGLKSELYRLVQAGNVAPRVDTFVAVARPSSKEVLQSVRRPYFSSDGNHLHYGVKVFLPNASDCPWCEELTLLRAFRDKLGVDSKKRADLRVRRLESEVRAPFILDSEDVGGNLITKGAFVGDLRPIAAFAAMSSVAQGMLCDIEVEALGAKRQVVNVPMIIPSYFEAVLLAGLLRTFKRKHLRWTGQDKELGDVLQAIDPGRVYPGVIPELAWAAVKNKIPARPVLDLIEKTGPASADLKMLCELIWLNTALG